MTSTDSIDAALASALEKFGRIDVMINNAGINTFGVAEALPESAMRGMMETNFWGPMHLTRKAVGIFRDVNPAGTGEIGGTVVNVSSIGGRVAFPAEAGYHASKFALEGFTEAIASELAAEWKIRVMILEPGGTKSSFTASSGKEGAVTHSKYAGDTMAVNQMLNALTDPGINEGLVEAGAVAKCVFDVLNKEEVLPLRLPTGKDSFAAIKGKEVAKMEELEKWKGVSEGVGEGDIPT